MIEKEVSKTLNKIDKNLETINPQNVSFLLCYKYVDPQQERGLLYYEIIPFLPISAATKIEDLRSNKVYKLPQNRTSANTQEQVCLKILKDYGLDPKAPHTYCKTLSYKTILNVAHLSGVKAKIFLIDGVDTFERLSPKYIVDLCEKMMENEKSKAQKKLAILNPKLNKNETEVERPIRS